MLLLHPFFWVLQFFIWKKDGAPIFFGHYRVGYKGRVFRCLKFRTMYRDSASMLSELLATSPEARAEWARDQKLANDPRITPIGHFLRKTSLDELPQLINVLRGEMNLVGPRPIVVEELTRYGRVRWDYLAVKPGITGLWQVSGRNLVRLRAARFPRPPVRGAPQLLVRRGHSVPHREGAGHPRRCGLSLAKRPHNCAAPTDNMKPAEYATHHRAAPDDSSFPRGAAVIHLVGRISNDVFSFLGPLTQTLAAKGVAQVVITHADEEFKHNLALLDSRVRVILLPAARSPLQWAGSMMTALVAEAKEPNAVYCHLHGVIPSIVGAWASRRNGLGVKLMFSPHGSRSLGPLKPVGRLLIKALRLVVGNTKWVPVTNSGEDARRVSSVSAAPVTVIESPVDDAFFKLAHEEGRVPTVVAGVGLPDAEAVTRFAQLAVLYWAESRPVQFVWAGPVNREGRARLRAAGVVVHTQASLAVRADLLSSAWVYLALGKAEGFSSLLAEAMAAGLPCMAWDQPHHRDLIVDGMTGQLVQDEMSALHQLTAWLNSAEERKRLGGAARTVATLRFTRVRFDTLY